jgi:hypothetical protein
MKLCVFAMTVILGCGIGLVRAETKPDSTRNIFEKIPAAEVPARAAEIVSLAKTADRNIAASETVKTAVKAHPTTAVATVGAISTKCPETAPITAATAAALLPKQARIIAHAAAKAAPSQAGAIVKAVCKVVPGDYREVALVVGAAAPLATRDIIAGLSEALPNLKPRLDAAVASYNGNLPSVGPVLDRAGSGNPGGLTPLASPGLRGPTVGGPYINLSGTPTNVPSGGGVVPPGGRDYAAP